MKYLFLILGLIYFTGCGKLESSPQSKNADSLERVIYDLKSQVSNLNAFIAQQSPASKQTANSSTSTEQTLINAEKNINKSPLEAWTEVRNGATINVRWQLKVFIGSQCYLMIDEKMTSRFVAVYDSKVILHSGDIIVVTGEASGVDEMGDVKLHANNVVKKGMD